jgi:pseudoazurin
MNTLPWSLVVLLSTVLAFPSSAQKTHVLQIKDHAAGQSMVFIPFFLQVDVGDTVTFVSDSIGHVTQSVFVPDGANAWQGEVGETVSVEMNREGIYLYECIFHGRLGMAGVIQAGEATNLDEARSFYGDYKRKFIIYRDRLDAIIENLEPPKRE